MSEERVSLGSNGTAPGRRIAFHCPGCQHAHSIVVDTQDGWGWNGDLVRPTFTPSVLVHSHKTFDAAGQVVDTPQCHSFVTDGSIQFLGDCTHALASQTVELSAWSGGGLVTTGRPVDRLVLESCPLHTEKPEWAAHAPAQVAAACKRGAHVIGLTETRGPIMAEVRRVAEGHGYRWVGHPVDEHRNVTLLLKDDLDVLHSDAVLVVNNYRVAVTFDFHGRRTTVFQMHWETHEPARATQTESLIKAMAEAARSGIAFYMGDSNPSQPQHMKGSQPNAMLSKAGMPVIFEELRRYPSNIGVTVVGRNKDRPVRALKVTTHPALGSDHVPVTAVYGIRRRLLRTKETR